MFYVLENLVFTIIFYFVNSSLVNQKLDWYFIICIIICTLGISLNQRDLRNSMNKSCNSN